MKYSTHPLGTLIETDVLVIGSGASGCGAAIGAKEQGLDTQEAIKLALPCNRGKERETGLNIGENREQCRERLLR